MTIKEFTALDTTGRNKVFIEDNCSVCKGIYTRQKRQINKWNTCSLRCTNVAKGNTIIHACDHCGELVFKAKSKAGASKSGKLFCSRECKESAQKYMVEIQPEHYGTGTGESGYRLLALNTYGYVCQRCGYDKHKAAIVVHHKDHSRDHNNIENLEVLCANCHAVHHWG